jgi:hypothetical protein
VQLALEELPHLSRGLLDQIKAFGLFGYYANIVLPRVTMADGKAPIIDLSKEISTADFEVLDSRWGQRNLDLQDLDWLERRSIAPLSPLFVMSSQQHLPRLDPTFPLLYRTVGWPNGVPPAGRLADSPDCTLNDAIASLSAFWRLQLHRPNGTLVAEIGAAHKVVRAALWLVRDAGFESALEYFFALVDNGFFLHPQVAWYALTMLLAARRATPDDASLPAYLLKDPPTAMDDWPKADFAKIFGLGPFQRELTDDAELLCGFVEDRAAAARAAATLDDWMIAYARLGIAANATHMALSGVGVGKLLAFSASVYRFQEFSADVGAYFHSTFGSLLVEANLPGPRYASSLRPTFAAAWVMAIKAKDKPDGWLDYLLEERVLVPDALLPLVKPNNLSLAVSLPETWQRPTPLLAPILGWFSFRDVWWSHHRMINDDKFCVPARVSAALIALGTDAEALTPYVALLLVAQSEAGARTFSPDMRAETIKLTIEDIATHLGIAPEAVPVWLDQVHLQLSTDDVDQVIREDRERDEMGQHEENLMQTEQLLRAYPFSGVVHAERAVRMVDAGKFDDAWTIARNAVLLDPIRPNNWRSAAIALLSVGAIDDGEVANALAETIKNIIKA